MAFLLEFLRFAETPATWGQGTLAAIRSAITSPLKTAGKDRSRPVELESGGRVFERIFCTFNDCDSACFEYWNVLPSSAHKC